MSHKGQGITVCGIPVYYDINEILEIVRSNLRLFQASDVTVSPTMPPTAAVAVGGYGLPEGADFSSHPKNIGASR